MFIGCAKTVSLAGLRPSLQILFFALFGLSAALAQNDQKSRNSDLVCQHYAAKEAERQGSVVRGAAQGALNGAVVGVFLGGSQSAQQGAMLGLVVGGYQRGQKTKQSYNKAYSECRDGQMDIR